MTGGRVVVLGDTGRNFAAGMSGGIAYVFDKDNTFSSKLNTEMIYKENLENSSEIAELLGMVKNHVKYTDSSLGKKYLIIGMKILKNL